MTMTREIKLNLGGPTNRGTVARVLAEVHRLPTTEQMIIKLRFGLLTGAMLSHKQVSDHVGLPAAEVRRVERATLERIANELNWSE